jgi:hypothetical protein
MPGMSELEPQTLSMSTNAPVWMILLTPFHDGKDRAQAEVARVVCYLTQ